MKWRLYVTIFDIKVSYLKGRIVKIDTKTNSYEEAFRKAFRWIKRSASKVKSTRRYVVTLCNTNYMFADKAVYSTPQRIRRIEDPKEFWVKGYGSEVVNKIFEDKSWKN